MALKGAVDFRFKSSGGGETKGRKICISRLAQNDSNFIPGAL